MLTACITLNISELLHTML